MRVRNSMCSSTSNGREKDRCEGESKDESVLHHKLSKVNLTESDGTSCIRLL